MAEKSYGRSGSLQEVAHDDGHGGDEVVQVDASILPLPRLPSHHEMLPRELPSHGREAEGPRSQSHLPDPGRQFVQLPLQRSLIPAFVEGCSPRFAGIAGLYSDGS